MDERYASIFQKIEATKKRIEKIRRPSMARKRRDTDWEDFMIETLLFHQVKEEEIEKRHYNTLLDIHVFNYGYFGIFVVFVRVLT
ncbi:hypothetical protein Ccrd_025823, partial [Cynara cardunculus var. scolymus]